MTPEGLDPLSGGMDGSGSPSEGLTDAKRVPDLKAYMGFDREAGSEEGACLIFAHSAREAKVIGYPVLSGWGIDWLDVGVRRLKDWGHEQANPAKLAAGIPHVIKSPKGCPGCDIWGYEIMESGYCESCDLEREDELSGDGAAVGVGASPEPSNPPGNPPVPPAPKGAA